MGEVGIWNIVEKKSMITNFNFLCSIFIREGERAWEMFVNWHSTSCDLCVITSRSFAKQFFTILKRPAVSLIRFCGILATFLFCCEKLLTSDPSPEIFLHFINFPSFFLFFSVRQQAFVRGSQLWSVIEAGLPWSSRHERSCWAHELLDSVTQCTTIMFNVG